MPVYSTRNRVTKTISLVTGVALKCRNCLAGVEYWNTLPENVKQSSSLIILAHYIMNILLNIILYII